VLPQDPNLKQSILSVLRSNPAIELAILFGSIAAGKERNDSDLDLAVLAAQPMTVAEKMSLISALAVEIGRAVDLVDLRSVGEPLLGQILQHGIRILGSNSQYASLIRKHLFEQADFMPYRNRILSERRHAWIGK